MRRFLTLFLQNEYHIQGHHLKLHHFVNWKQTEYWLSQAVDGASV